MPWIYHELQEAGLCGVHCLNNLLQGPYFGPAELMEIALELDQHEKNLMAELGTDTDDYAKFAKQESSNVGMSGDFSVNVLQTALSRVWNLSCSDTRSPEKQHVIKNPTVQTGFLCNLEDHWIALRKIDGSWWNLNSLEDKPAYLSEIYLGVFLKQLELEGWSIFVVEGDYPPLSQDPNGEGWTFMSPGTKADKMSQVNNNNQNAEDYFNEDDQFDAELAAALKASLAENQNSTQTSEVTNDTQNNPPQQTQPSGESHHHHQEEEEEMDEELKLALKMSLAEQGST